MNKYQFFNYFEIEPVRLHTENCLYKDKKDLDIYPDVNNPINHLNLISCLLDCGFNIKCTPINDQLAILVVLDKLKVICYGNECLSLCFTGFTLWECVYNVCNLKVGKITLQNSLMDFSDCKILSDVCNELKAKVKTQQWLL